MPASRILFLAALLSVCCVERASAQDGRVRRQPRAYLVLSDGVGISGGGALTGSSGLSQMMRVSGVLGIRGSHGIEVSAVRIREIIPAAKRVDDPLSNDPRADGLLLSYASLSRQRGGGFPSTFSLGGGVMRRPSADPAKDRETWGAHVGLESDMYRPPGIDWGDVSAGARLVVMPGTFRQQIYVVAITLGIRIG